MTWYRLTVNGHSSGVTPLTPEQAKELRAMGYQIEPASAPADLATRMGNLLAGLARLDGKVQLGGRIP